MPTFTSSRPTVVFVSTYPPRKCGIGTFTADLIKTFDSLFGSFLSTRVVAVNDKTVSRYFYPAKVIDQIQKDERSSYLQIARRLNSDPNIQLVCLQHEFGLFGGKFGSYIVAFLKELKKPVVTTFHTVLPTPNSALMRTVNEVIRYSRGVVVMSKKSKKILEDDYDLPKTKIKVIPHGIHQQPYETSAAAKVALGFAGKTVLLTFGLLSRNKGIEYVLESLPRVIRTHPEVCYVVAGVTHPEVLKREGESYRKFLINKVGQLKLLNHVRFYNSFFNLKDLLRLLGAADLYISSGLDPNQAVSGTLSYALGQGRPVVSTAFAQASEVVKSDVGLLVNFRKPAAFTDAILSLVSDPSRREQMGKNAYFRTRNCIWPNVALSYQQFFGKATPAVSNLQKSLPPLNLAHLANLTDDFGIVQFAQLSKPDPASGYTLDDNARALVAAVKHYVRFHQAQALRLAKIYLNFIARAQQSDGTFYNYMNQERRPDLILNSRDSLEEASARGFYALAFTAAQESLPRDLRREARALLERSAKGFSRFSSARPVAILIKAFYIFPGLFDQRIFRRQLKRFADKLAKLYRQHSHDESWRWFEDELTYNNAVLPESLFLAYRILGKKNYLTIARGSLDFLIGQCFRHGAYVSIGQNGWSKKFGPRSLFDQQPEDVAATVQALQTAWQATGEERYKNLQYRTFYWFLGNNLLGQIIYDTSNGGCFDGLGERSVNLNQGGESTISYLLARLSL